MNMKKNWIALGAALMLGLTGCGKQPAVNAEQAGMLASAVSSSDKFAGVVVSESAVEITRDTDKQIEELYVAVGDTVRVNEKLFEYDTDTLSLAIDKQELEMDKLEQQIKDLTTQKNDLEKQIKNEKDKTVKATLELSLRSVNADLTQATYDKDSLRAEINYNKDMLKNAVVRSPIKGTIRSIDENGTPYITIQQSGAYQVKGLLNELSLNAGIMVGSAVTVISRIDSNQVWTGVVSAVDYNNTETNPYDSMYGYGLDGSGLSNSTSYPFYITLDSTDGLLLGQHVYIQLSAGAADNDQLWLPESYLMDINQHEFDSVTGKVWTVDESSQLIQRQVVLGAYDSLTGSYEVLSGLTLYDYIADPSNPDCKEGAAVQIREVSDFFGAVEE